MERKHPGSHAEVPGRPGMADEITARCPGVEEARSWPRLLECDQREKLHFRRSTSGEYDSSIGFGGFCRSRGRQIDSLLSTQEWPPPGGHSLFRDNFRSASPASPSTGTHSADAACPGRRLWCCRGESASRPCRTWATRAGLVRWGRRCGQSWSSSSSSDR